jgi:integrase
MIVVEQKGFEVDIRLLLPGGKEIRERKKARVRSESGARRWGEARERHLLRRALQGRSPGKEVRKKKVPTLAEFSERFLSRYAEPENKPSEVQAKRSILNTHLLPKFGERRLDQITDEDVADLKAALKTKGRKEKTINNVLLVLHRLLRIAVEWKVIDKVEPTIRLLKLPEVMVRFYEEEELDTLLSTAGKVDDRVRLIVLLGADAGLRLGEMIALEHRDIDYRRGRLTVERSDWHGKVGLPKNRRVRTVPLTRRLGDAVRGHRHLRSARVLCTDDGAALDRNTIKRWIASAQRQANLHATGAVHRLRHTFCTRLATRGVPPRTIMELAGHRSLTTTMRYMHVCKGAPEAAIKTLDQHAPTVQADGELLEIDPEVGTSS